MPSFATDPAALVTTMTAAEKALGLTCGTMTIERLNGIFKELFAGVGVDKYLVGLSGYDPLTNIMTLNLSDGTTVAIPFTALMADALTVTANANDTVTLVANGTSICIPACGPVDYAHAGFLAVGTPVRINPNIGDTGCIPSSAVISAQTNCTIIVNVDGTHTVTATNAACGSGTWSYVSTQNCGAKTISGVVDQALVDYPFTLINTTTAGLLITTVTGAPVTILWGDGATSNVASGIMASHTYASSFSGTVIVRILSCAQIKRFETSSGGWNFNLSAIPPSVKEFVVNAASGLTGNVSSIPLDMTFFQVYGTNTITGNIAGLPSTLTLFNVANANTISGSISNMPTGIKVFVVTGQNTLVGNILNIPNGVQVFAVTGQNTITGDITNIPSSVVNFQLYGSNNISGNLSTLKPTITSFAVQGANTVTGDISGIPSGATLFELTGSNTVSGNIASTLGKPIAYFGVRGSNTISGNINQISATIRFFDVRGSNTLVGGTWSGSVTNARFVSIISSGRTPADVDAILIGLTGITNWIQEKGVEVNGSNPPPTAAGLAAKATILANGALSVITN